MLAFDLTTGRLCYCTAMTRKAPRDLNPVIGTVKGPGEDGNQYVFYYC